MRTLNFRPKAALPLLMSLVCGCLISSGVFSQQYHLSSDANNLNLRDINGNARVTKPTYEPSKHIENKTSVVLTNVVVSPVKVYPTTIAGDHVNINSRLPVERIIITSTNGTNLFTKELSGQSDYISLNLPSLKKGMYLLTCIGNGWRSTDKILVP
jgi:hypothetical protein